MYLYHNKIINNELVHYEKNYKYYMLIILKNSL